MVVVIELAETANLDLLSIAQATQVVIQTTTGRIHLRMIGLTKPPRPKNS